MSLQIEVPSGATARTIFETLAYENGPRVAPDSAPEVGETFVNGTAVALTATIAQMQDDVPANITGVYQLSFATGSPNSLSAGDTVWVEVLATISSIATRKVYQFLIVPSDSTVTPVIR